MVRLNVPKVHKIKENKTKYWVRECAYARVRRVDWNGLAKNSLNANTPVCAKICQKKVGKCVRCLFCAEKAGKWP